MFCVFVCVLSCPWRLRLSVFRGVELLFANGVQQASFNISSGKHVGCITLGLFKLICVPAVLLSACYFLIWFVRPVIAVFKFDRPQRFFVTPNHCGRRAPRHVVCRVVLCVSKSRSIFGMPVMWRHRWGRRGPMLSGFSRLTRILLQIELIVRQGLFVEA